MLIMLKNNVLFTDLTGITTSMLTKICLYTKKSLFTIVISLFLIYFLLFIGSKIFTDNKSSDNAYLLMKSPLLLLNELPLKQNSFKSIFQFKRPKEVEHLNCPDFLIGSNKSLEEYRKKRVTVKDSDKWVDLPMNCESIKSRHYFQLDDLYPEEKEFPIAFSRVVFRDYKFLEMELASSYTPQNFYCYALDSKAPWIFRSRMQSLANCFPNVFITQHEFKVERHGLNMDQSNLECMKILIKHKWKYLILLQNYDVSLKTNQELIQIFKWFNGTNDVGSLPVLPTERLKKEWNWTVKDLGLIKNATKEEQQIELNFAKSFVQISLSRQMVDHLFNKFDLTQMLERFGNKYYKLIRGFFTLDEIVMGTLNSEDALKVPGGYTQSCLKKGHKHNALTRLSYWNGEHECLSNIMRHNICVFGMENLKELQSKAFLYANKFLSENDFGAISCWLEHLHNRTHLNRGTDNLDSQVYLNLPTVRFNREKAEQGKDFDVNKFNCTIGIVNN